MNHVIVATDLDGTVMFSERAMGAERPDDGRLRPVDTVGPDVYSYMTHTAAARWAEMVGTGAVVPVTTRSEAQYRRLRLPGTPPPYAVVCNGARLLVDGVADPAWEDTVRRRMADAAAPFAEVWARAEVWRTEHSFAVVRAVEDFFVYLTVVHREEWFDEFARVAEAWCRNRGWRVSLQGRKLYLLPVSLDKAPAVAEVAARLGAGRVVAGGDSLLDERMLRTADAAIRPAHGELHVIGFSTAHCRVTVARGAAAGDEIMDWYAEQLAVPDARQGAGGVAVSG